MKQGRLPIPEDLQIIMVIYSLKFNLELQQIFDLFGVHSLRVIQILNLPFGYSFSGKLQMFTVKMSE